MWTAANFITEGCIRQQVVHDWFKLYCKVTTSRWVRLLVPNSYCKERLQLALHLCVQPLMYICC